jgi:outer membrane receptor protein involved in Fe transport
VSAGTIRGAVLIAGIATFSSMRAWSQGGAPPPDSARAQSVSPVVTVAERAAAPVANSTAAISMLEGRELSRRPLRSLADALQHAPGLSFVDFDGLGGDPQLMVRGFYGGGEAEYVVLLLDGRPVNALETGRINWDLIPLAAVQSIEVVRGGSSAAWGDAALGGVINVVTVRDAGRSLRGTVAGGGHGSLRASLSLFDPWDDLPASGSATFSRVQGFRDHAERTNGGFKASLGLLRSDRAEISVSTVNDWRAFDEPGPLPETARRTSSDPFYRFDKTKERTHRLSLDGSRATGAASRFMASLVGEYRHADRVRTVPLFPGGFADTKERVLGTSRLLATSQIEIGALPLPGDDELVAGLETSLGHMGSEYYQFFRGSPTDYSGASPSRGELDESGTALRSTAAAFMHYGLQATSVLRFTAGGRLDWLNDEFDSRSPSDPASYSATHVAFSPKVGANLRYLASDRNEGHLYANIARSFKAPTPDQLFDQRMIPVAVDISFSNPMLEPQYGTSIEAGINHRSAWIPGRLSSKLTLSAYTMEMRDELDFDFTTFRYENIRRSRHRGLESSLDLSGPGVDLFANYTLQVVTSRAGDTFGKQLKAIPRHVTVAGVTMGTASPAKASIIASSAQRIYLDDANTRELPRWTRWDARASYSIGSANVFADVFNLFDTEYRTTGFPDPAGTDAFVYHPAAGRTLQAGISWEM